MAREWSDNEVRQMREERAMGAKVRDLCRKFSMSEGHMSRILAGTARPEAGGPIMRGKETLPDRRSDLDKLLTMTPEEQTAFYLKTKAELEAEQGRIKQQPVREEVISERALGYGARVRGQVRVPVWDSVELSPSGVPMPPDLLQERCEEARAPDAGELLDEFMKR